MARVVQSNGERRGNNWHGALGILVYGPLCGSSTEHRARSLIDLRHGALTRMKFSRFFCMLTNHAVGGSKHSHVKKKRAKFRFFPLLFGAQQDKNRQARQALNGWSVLAKIVRTAGGNRNHRHLSTAPLRWLQRRFVGRKVCTSFRPPKRL